MIMSSTYLIGVPKEETRENKEEALFEEIQKRETIKSNQRKKTQLQRNLDHSNLRLFSKQWQKLVVIEIELLKL